MTIFRWVHHFIWNQPTLPCIAAGSLNRVPALIGCGKSRNVTFVGWQVTMGDPIRHVSSPNSEAGLWTATLCLLYFTHTHTQLFYGSLDFVGDNPGEPVPEETFTHSNPSWSSVVPYLLHPSTLLYLFILLTSKLRHKTQKNNCNHLNKFLECIRHKMVSFVSKHQNSFGVVCTHTHSRACVDLTI